MSAERYGRPVSRRTVFQRQRVAVGTALSGRPPHRSQRAGLPHWAPASGQTRRRCSGYGCMSRGYGSQLRMRRFIRSQFTLVL
jgi:hypothetical protein